MMKKKPSSSSSKQISRRAWNLLRIALLWARKGGVFKNRFMFDHFRTLPKFIKSLAHHQNQDQQWNALHYGERQLSFDDTPVIHVKMHRPSSLRFKIPNIPCINAPSVDFDYDFDQDFEDQMNYNETVVARKSFLKGAEEEEDESCEEEGEIKEGSEGCECDEGIDRKAEEFIANFYKQMKLQRQISYLQYHDKINGDAN